ncbi:hypothetical protein SAMN04488564_103640 [Lentzea waywayandensis]|uniref:Methyltransferase domain-containing protein n=1 Tax=Lentzea waywayandensis TaxID=84724 RepID=A0A1I6E278_9PSEU|nr:hypothetical protein [Lentzea waywayandensis]SFR11727.1 hypothetical protein SAMN04488564_103640 [Lentzea waywayandensis]
MGIDIAQGALDFAADEVAEDELSDRISFALDDARNLTTAKPEYEKVELLTCFMMGHDFWSRENCVRNLRELSRTCASFCSGTPPGRSASRTWTSRRSRSGSRSGHDMMATYVPTIDE